MKPFEMLVMIKPGLEDDVLAACRGRLEGWLADNGAKTDEVMDLGELPLSYPVKKQKRGRFLLFWFILHQGRFFRRFFFLVPNIFIKFFRRIANYLIYISNAKRLQCNDKNLINH